MIYLSSEKQRNETILSFPFCSLVKLHLLLEKKETRIPRMIIPSSEFHARSIPFLSRPRPTILIISLSSLFSPSLPSHQDLLVAGLVSCRDERDVIVTPLLFHVPIRSMSGSYSTMSQFPLLPHTFPPSNPILITHTWSLAAHDSVRQKKGPVSAPKSSPR
jgi:hypothetical protein